jgi:hypothetical protein
MGQSPAVPCLLILSASAQAPSLQRRHLKKDWCQRQTLPLEVLRGLQLHESSRPLRLALPSRHVSDYQTLTMALLRCLYRVGDGRCGLGRMWNLQRLPCPGQGYLSFKMRQSWRDYPGRSHSSEQCRILRDGKYILHSQQQSQLTECPT